MGGLGPPRGPLWPLWRNLSKMGAIPPRKSSPFWLPFRTQIHKNPKTVVKCGCPESSQEKSGHRTSPGVAQCGIHTVTAICFEGSSLVPSGGFWVTFGYLSGSLLVTLGSKWPVLGAKKRSKKSGEKKVRKGHATILDRGLCGPKRVPTRPQPGVPGAQRTTARRPRSPGGQTRRPEVT